MVEREWKVNPNLVGQRLRRMMFLHDVIDVLQRASADCFMDDQLTLTVTADETNKENTNAQM